MQTCYNFEVEDGTKPNSVRVTQPHCQLSLVISDVTLPVRRLLHLAPSLLCLLE